MERGRDMGKGKGNAGANAVLVIAMVIGFMALAVVGGNWLTQKDPATVVAIEKVERGSNWQAVNMDEQEVALASPPLATQGNQDERDRHSLPQWIF